MVFMYFIKKQLLSLMISFTLFVAIGCSSTVKTVDLSTLEGANIDQLYIVDCLLPSNIRQLGAKLTYLGARRVIKTSGSDCAIRGGEFTAYDRANYQTALNIWLPLAQKGGAKAQTYVGEIYEKGLGTLPNYPQAAQWYQQASNQGYARAKMSLGSLYERGLGVPQDPVKALSLYRDASGLTEQQLEFVTVAQRQARITQSKQLVQSQSEKQAAQALATQLQSEIQQLKDEVSRLKNIPAKRVIVTIPSPITAAQIEQKKQLAVLKKKLKKKEKQLKKQEKQQEQQANKTANEDNDNKVGNLSKKNNKQNSQLKGINFGRYYAVIIGNNNYTSLPNLPTASNDAQTIASVLKNQYGFKTIVLANASKGKILAALDSLRKRLTRNDNLIIYYAGHGILKEKNGYWSAADSQQNVPKTWISNKQITNFIDAMQAKHVLVIADSCYSGTLSQSSIPRLTDNTKSRAWFDAVANAKVRIVMSSGGLKPTLDAKNAKHSVFAKAFLKVLRSGDSVMEGASLFQALRQHMKTSSNTQGQGKQQNPLYAPIRFSGHEAGDFIFLQNGRIASLYSLPTTDENQKMVHHLFARGEYVN